MDFCFRVSVGKSRHNIRAKTPADALRRSYEEYGVWSFDYAIEEWFPETTDYTDDVMVTIDKLLQGHFTTETDKMEAWELIMKELSLQPLAQGRPVVEQIQV